MRSLALLLAVASVASAAVTKKFIPGDYAADISGLQSAINACASANQTDPYIIEIAKGTTINLTAPLVFPGQTNATKWCIIRSSGISDGSLPEGKRVGSADAANLVKLDVKQYGAYGDSLLFPASATNPSSHYILQGIEATYSGVNPAQDNAAGIIAIGLTTTGGKASKLTEEPHDIIIDRCWTHGTTPDYTVASSSASQIRNGVRIDGMSLTIKHSTIENMIVPNKETHGIFESNGAGPFYIYNNKISGGTIKSLMGGETPWIAGMIALGSYWQGNEYAGEPTNIHFLDTGSASGATVGDPCLTGAYYQESFTGGVDKQCVAGVWANASGTRLWRNWQKNLWECKNCRYALTEGNVLHDGVATGDQSQYGHTYLINHVDYNEAPWARPEYITIRFNKSYHNGQGMIATKCCGGTPKTDFNHLRIAHNIMGVGDVVANPPGLSFQGTNNIQSSFGSGYNVQMRNNTFIYETAAGGKGILMDEVTAGVEQRDYYFADNIYGQANYGFYTNGPTYFGERCNAVDLQVLGTRYHDYYALVDTNSKGSGYFNSLYAAAGCPTHKTRVASYATLGFVDYAGGDYRICTAVGVPAAACTGASTLATASSVGGPLGADAQNVSYATQGVTSGTADKAFFEFQIRRADKAAIRYTAYDSSACSGTIKNLAGTTVDSWTDAGGYDRDRSHTNTSLSAGEHTVRVTCNGRWKESTFVAY